MDQQAQKKEEEEKRKASIAPVTAEITTTFIVCRPRTPESIMEYGNFTESPSRQMDRQGQRSG